MSRNSHCFNVELATKIGLEESILLQHFFWWFQHNKHTPEMCRDGRVWFFRSVAEMREEFPYLTASNVRTAIEHLIRIGYVVRGDYSERSMNKSTWYALTDFAIREFDFAESTNPFTDLTNGFAESDKCIDNSKIDIRKGSRRNRDNTSSNFDFRAALLGIGVSEEAADTWLLVRRKARAINSELAFKDFVAEVERTGQSADWCVRYAATNSWRGFKADWIRPHLGAGTYKPRKQESIYEKNARAFAEYKNRQNIQHADEQ